MARIVGTVKRAAVTDSVSPCNNYGRSCGGGHGWLDLEATRAWKKRPYYSLTLQYDVCSVNNQGRVIRRRTSVHSSSRRRPSPAAAVTAHEGCCGQLVTEYGWEVGRLSEVKKSHQILQRVALVQAQAFHVPMPLFNDSFFYFFQAEVLSGLLYKLRNSPPDRYACLVAMPSNEESSSDQSSRQELIVGVVDATVLSDRSVLQHLQGAPEYMYVSGIAVLDTHRRRKVATALLKACDVLCVEWGLEYTVLRAYEDDMGARRLYANAGYSVVSKDPIWLTTLIGRKRRVLMVKRSTPLVNDSHLART